ncbi:STM4015 family protein [Plantactinospora sp. B5E13]|uniref:STM4015 family protein n=1 Tax=unclassified Plantactinospora TaxID=2631981 RepID=UPI00325E4F82
MTINTHLTELAGLPVVTFDPQEWVPEEATGTVAWRLDLQGPGLAEDRFVALTEAFLDTVTPVQVRVLLIGDWGDSAVRPAPVDLLVGLAPRLRGLRALFVGEMTYEQCEISWIVQADPAPLLTAYPDLEVLRIRGATERLTPVRHSALRELAIETGGLPGSVARAVAECDLPALTHLELWLGTDEYGGDTSVADLAPILSGDRLPALRHLGLRDAEHADQVAAAVAQAPLVGQLESLDLSLGTLSDAGADALLAGQPLTRLRRLDLHHHYLSPEARGRLTAALPDVEINLADRQRESRPGARYVAVSE